MRKCFQRRDNRIELDILQCGRIYKDAEIIEIPNCLELVTETFNVAASIKMRKCRYPLAIQTREHNLQCGRIYKDAEICANNEVSALIDRPSMWPHL